MMKSKFNYLYLIIAHIILAGLIYVFPFLSKIYSILIFLFGILVVIKTQNNNNQALVISAYAVGVEVFLRMTDGAHFNEYGKYSIMVFLFLGILFKGFSRGAFIYVFFILLLIPGVILSTTELSLGTDIRKAIAFNISGPVCLGVSAIYCYKREITFDRFKSVLEALGYPLVAMLAYLYLYTPSVKDVVTSTQSNFETSGGFGPNQVSTVLGLAFFVFFAQFMLNSSSKLVQLANGFFVVLFAYRGLVTFSRGGVFTGLAMIVLLLLIAYLQFNAKAKVKIILLMVGSFFVALSIWAYSSIQTSGLIDKRYANEDVRGKKKESQLTGREKLIETELNMFMNSPLLGIGVGKNKEYREQETGIEAASHNEITRMMAEHGSLGILGLLILLITPIILYFNNRQNLFAFSFLAFWILTINHAAMRIAAPAFVYALSILRIRFTAPENLNTEDYIE